MVNSRGLPKKLTAKIGAFTLRKKGIEKTRIIKVGGGKTHVKVGREK